MDMPDLPPELLALYSKRAQALGAPNVAPPGGVPPAAGMPPTGMPQPSAQPAQPAGQPPAQPAGGASTLAGAFGRPTTPIRTTPTAPSPAPSDDPALTGGLPPLPTPPQPGPMMTKLNADVQKRGSLQAPDASQYRPKWYDRLAGAAVGFASGYGNAERGVEVGSGVTDRRFNKANADYQSQVNPLDAQIAQERGAAELESKTSGEGFTRNLELAREGRERQTGQARVDYLGSRAAEQDETVKKLQDQIDHPKASAGPKNADEALSAASSAKDPTEKTRLIKLAGDLHNQEIDRVKAARPPKEDKTKTATPQQYAAVEGKKATALQKARTAYQKATSAAVTDDDRKQANDDFQQAQQDAQDAYEGEIRDLGGSADHQDVSTWNGKPKTAAASTTAPAKGNAPPSSLWQGKDGQILHLRNKSTGNVEKWALVGGVPTKQ